MTVNTLAERQMPPLPPATPAAASRRRRNRSGRWLLLLAAPAIALFAFVLIVPTIRGSFFAFTDWDGISPDFEFVGFENFVQVVTDPDSQTALFVTILIAVAVTVIQNLFGLALALGVNSNIKSKNVLRVFLFAPAVLTPVVTAFLWKYILAPEGTLNSTLEAVGLGALAQSWLGSQGWALFSIIMVIVWQFSGYSMVIFLAGLQSIPHEVNEAAEMDGAGRFARFWHITRPLLGPAFTINIVLCSIGGFKQFDQVFVLTGGGPGGSTHTLSTLIYKSAFTYGEFGYSMAMAIVLTLFVALVSVFQYRGVTRREGRS